VQSAGTGQNTYHIPTYSTSQSEVQNYKPYLHTPPTTTWILSNSYVRVIRYDKVV
jgi:hypothetical protein